MAGPCMLNEGIIGARNFLRGGSAISGEDSEDRGKQVEDAGLGPRQPASRSQSNPEHCSSQRGIGPISKTSPVRGKGQPAGRQEAFHQNEPLSTAGPLTEAADKQPTGDGSLLDDRTDIVPDTQDHDSPHGPAQEAVRQGLQHCGGPSASVRPPAAGVQTEPGRPQLQAADPLEQSGGDTVPDSQSPGGSSRSLRSALEMQLDVADAIIPKSQGSGDALDTMRVASIPGSRDGAVQADMELDAVHQPDEPANDAENPLDKARDSSEDIPLLPALQLCLAPQCSGESHAASAIAAAGDRQVSDPDGAPAATQSAEQAATVGQQEVRRGGVAKLPEAADPGSSASSKASQLKEASAQEPPEQPAMAPAARLQVSSPRILAARVSLAGTPQLQEAACGGAGGCWPGARNPQCLDLTSQAGWLSRSNPRRSCKRLLTHRPWCPLPS